MMDTCKRCDGLIDIDGYDPERHGPLLCVKCINVLVEKYVTADVIRKRAAAIHGPTIQKLWDEDQAHALWRSCCLSQVLRLHVSPCRFDELARAGQPYTEDEVTHERTSAQDHIPVTRVPEVKLLERNLAWERQQQCKPAVKEQSPEVQALIADAAEAQEVIPIDELEEHANEEPYEQHATFWGGHPTGLSSDEPEEP